jgi:hypothetical protein
LRRLPVGLDLLQRLVVRVGVGVMVVLVVVLALAMRLMMARRRWMVQSRRRGWWLRWHGWVWWARVDLHVGRWWSNYYWNGRRPIGFVNGQRRGCCVDVRLYHDGAVRRALASQLDAGQLEEVAAADGRKSKTLAEL